MPTTFPPTRVFAVINLFVGLISVASIILLVCTPPFCTITGLIGTVFGIAAMVYGFKAKNFLEENPGKESGDRQATAGIIMGVASGGLNALTLIISAILTIIYIYVVMV